MYIINDYQLHSINSTSYLFNESKAAKIPNEVLLALLNDLQQQPKLEIDDETLTALAGKYQLPLEQLKTLLIKQLDILRPQAARKFRHIYLNVDDKLVEKLLVTTFNTHYNVHCCPAGFQDYEPGSLVIFYRQNYSDPAFQSIYPSLADDIFLISAGVIHNILVIDNLYFKDSGLPTHLSNLHQLMAFLNSNMPATKDNWLLFYRSLVKNKVDVFPEPRLNDCQRGFIAYCLYQFASQYTAFWKAPTAMDQINWFWHADLTSFDVHKEVAVHSAFSEYDMNLEWQQIRQAEQVE